MKYVFSSVGDSLLQSLALTKTLYAFDFDGTLSPIVSRPDAAQMGGSTASLLQSLAKVAPVAILSGRSIKDLKKRLDIEIPHLVGNHGLETVSSDEHSQRQVSSSVQDWKREFEGRRDFDPGVFIEDKKFSLAIHYRHSRNKKADRKKILEVAEALHPSPRIVLGKLVVNVIPKGSPHKGIALQELLDRGKLNCALYVGDDDTDEDVFSMPDRRIVSVRVGARKSSQAQFFIRRQSEVNRLIREVLHRIERGTLK